MHLLECKNREYISFCNAEMAKLAYFTLKPYIVAIFECF